MADFGDEAQAVNDHFLSMALKYRPQQKGPAATGACLYCGERVKAGLRWCDSDCRDGWQEEQKILGGV